MNASLSDERGVSLVLFAVMLPLILVLGVISIDVGNWWVHKRHLQTQADAGALAAGPQFVGCFFDWTAANSAITSKALAYAGDTLRPGNLGPTATSTTTNRQVQTPDDVRMVLNSTRYWQSSDGTSSPSNGYGLDNSADGDPSTPAFESSHPCDSKFLDVMGTDDKAPLLWGLIPVSASPNAHAKIEIRDLVSARGMLPWAVPEIDPARVAALFVNEFNGSVFDWQYLDANDDPGLPWSEWTTSVGQEPVTLGGANDRTSIVVLVSKNDSSPSMTGTLAQICGQDPGLVKCYAGSGQTSGASFIHAYNGTFSGTKPSPQARQVQLAATGCSAADLSAPYFTLDGACSAVVQAVIDFGVSGDPRPLSKACASVAGYTWSANGLGGSLGTWTGSVALPADAGRQAVSLSWTSGNNEQGKSGNCANNQPNSGTLAVVAAPYVSDTASGPIQYLKLNASLASTGVPVGDANSVEKDNYLYGVKVGLPKPLSVLPYTDPPLMLRMASPSGSQNRAFDCDRGGQYSFEDEIRDGCRTTYIENYRDVDGDGDKEWNNIDCTGYNTQNLPPSTFNPNPLPDCVMTEPGDKTGPLRGGLKLRFESPCVPNNWPDNATEAATFFGPNGGGYGNDPRYVTLIITDDTAFGSSGADPYPIKYFAGFYVTGWDMNNGSGPQSTNGCPDPDGTGPLKGNDCHPIYGCSYNQSLDNGDVWGYFVDLVVFSSNGDPSDELCTFGADPAACVAILTE